MQSSLAVTFPSNAVNNIVQRRVRRLLAEGRVKTFAEGELVVRLIEEEHPEEEVYLVVKETADYEEAVSLLRQDCELCAGQVPFSSVVK